MADIKVIPARTALIEKVSETGGKSFEDMAKEGALIAEKYASQFPPMAMQSINSLHQLIEDIATGNGYAIDKTRAFDHLLHNLKGQGGTFGWPLLTEIATAFCDFLEKLQLAGLDMAASDRSILPIAKMHVNAMQQVMERKIKDSEDVLGRELINGLRKVTKKMTEALPQS
ncbi:MAG: hypothetical protein ACOYK8_02430 [Alphaproteobacteria bacterium]